VEKALSHPDGQFVIYSCSLVTRFTPSPTPEFHLNGSVELVETKGGGEQR